MRRDKTLNYVLSTNTVNLMKLQGGGGGFQHSQNTIIPTIPISVQKYSVLVDINESQ